MGELTAIAWTEKTWNPVQGCHKISAGCKHCYMFAEKTRYGQDPNTVIRSKDATFYAPLKWEEPALIFTCSWSDWFIEDADQWRPEMWNVVRRTPQHTYQILTKRADRIANHLPPDWGDGWANVWLGVSIENEEMAEARLPHLLKAPAAVRFFSAEPLLGPLDLNFWLTSYWDSKIFDPITKRQGSWCENDSEDTGLHWGIVGGESDGPYGTNARGCNMEWIHSLIEQCGAADVPIFVKQLGAKPYYIDNATGAKVAFHITDPKGENVRDFPRHFPRQWPKVWQAKLDAAEAAAVAEAMGARP